MMSTTSHCQRISVQNSTGRTRHEQNASSCSDEERTSLIQDLDFTPKCDAKHNLKYSRSQPAFRFFRLPAEIRLQIYETYFSSLDPIDITIENASSFSRASKSSVIPLPINDEHTNLTTVSPFFIHDIPLTTFYQNATFRFSSGEAMKQFTLNEEYRKNVRNVCVRYGVEKQAERRGRDWVFLLGECFERLESVEFWICGANGGDGVGRRMMIKGDIDGEFEAEKECGLAFVCERCEQRWFEGWWRAVVDAFREGLPLGGSNPSRKRGVTLRCVREGGGKVVEVIF